MLTRWPTVGAERDRLVVLGSVAALISFGALLPFWLTIIRCDTNPLGDTDSTWRFSGYCRAFHSLHVFNYPDAVTGGGILNAVFLAPAMITMVGLVRTFGTRRVEPLRRSLVLAAAVLALLIVCALALASATFPGDA